MNRPCSKVACSERAVATLTYDYADSMAVLGPLSIAAEPHCYDLCARHAERLSAPQGWQVVRHMSLSTGRHRAPDPEPAADAADEAGSGSFFWS